MSELTGLHADGDGRVDGAELGHLGLERGDLGLLGRHHRGHIEDCDLKTIAKGCGQDLTQPQRGNMYTRRPLPHYYRTRVIYATAPATLTHARTLLPARRLRALRDEGVFLWC